MDEKQAALTVDTVRFRYDGTDVLHGVSFSVAPGEVCGLLGPNGSGKSTLFKCCMKFLRPSAGSVRLFGQDATHLKIGELARLVAYVPQEHSQPFPFPALDVVRMGRTPHMGGLFRLSRQDDDVAIAALERVGMTHVANTPCNQLSGGQRQLVLVARALAQQTPLLLLDEPTSALDFSNQIGIWDVLRRIAAEGVAVVVCCHDPNHIMWFCDRVVVLHEGRVLAQGVPDQVVDTAVLKTIYGRCCARSSLYLNDGGQDNPPFTLNLIHPRRLARHGSCGCGEGHHS